MAEDKIISLKAEIEKLTADLDKAREAGGAGGNLEASAELARALQDRKEMLEIVTRLTKESTEALKEENKEKEKAAEATTKNTKTQDDFSTALGRTLKTLTGATTGSETLIGSFFKLRKSVKEGKVTTEEFTKSMDGMFDSLDVGASIMSKVIQSTLIMAAAQDSALASFNKSTGAAGHYNRELLSLERSNRRLGISTAEMGESYSALMSGLSGFGTMAESERERLGELGAQYAKTGISASDFAGSVETMTRGFGMSTNAASGMVEESRQLAQALGRDVGSVVAELNQSLPQLASYGEDATDIFKDLERQSQRTGLAVGELISIAGNYRTFDSAATAAGNLNAVLNTQLFSSMGLLEAQLEGPDAVIEYMSENLANSIGDWDSLNTFQKEATANAASMSVMEMNNMMNQRSMTKEQKDRITTQEEAMKTAMSMVDELKILFAEFAISITPIFNAFKGIVGWASSLLQWGHDFLGVGGQIGVMLGLVLVGSFVKGIVKGLVYNSILGAQIPILAAIAAKYREIAQSKMMGGSGGVAPTQPQPERGSMLGPAGMGAGRVARGMSGLKVGGALSLLTMGAEIAAGGDKSEAVGAGIGGAIGAGLGAIGGPLGMMLGGMAGAKVGRMLGGGTFHEGGGVGGAGDVPAMVQGGEAIVPIQRTPAAENLASMVAERSSGGNNTQVVAAVQALGQKLDAVVSALNASGDFVMQVDDREFGRVINSHFGETGFQKIDLRTT